VDYVDTTDTPSETKILQNELESLNKKMEWQEWAEKKELTTELGYKDIE